jgi:hypothetical protein
MSAGIPLSQHKISTATNTCNNNFIVSCNKAFTQKNPEKKYFSLWKNIIHLTNQNKCTQVKLTLQNPLSNRLNTYNNFLITLPYYWIVFYSNSHFCEAMQTVLTWISCANREKHLRIICTYYYVFQFVNMASELHIPIDIHLMSNKYKGKCF